MHVQFLKAFATIDMGERRIPIVHLQGESKGPKIWLVANAHGDEVTGIEVIHRTLDLVREAGLRRGALYAMPSMNPMGSEVIQRTVPMDNDNLNRNYPGAPDGEPTERLAHLIFSRIVATAPHLVIDLHTSHIRSIPHVILDRFTDEEAHPGISAKLAEAAEVFGVTVVYDFAMEEYKKQKLDRSLPGALLNKARILAYTVELGPTRIVSEYFVEAGVQGTLNVLRSLGMTEVAESMQWVHPSKITEIGALRRDPEVRANCTGLIEFLVEPGQAVHAGQAVARIKDVLGAVLETIEARHAGYVIELADRAVAFPGTPILTVAVPDAEE
jgi:predicted deacylase